MRAEEPTPSGSRRQNPQRPRPARRRTPSLDDAVAPRSASGDGGRIRPPACEHVFVSYVELHCHSAFSFLDGASLPDELVAAALERGHTALALTDHDSVSGSMEFAQAARGLGAAGDPRRGGDVRRRHVRATRATSRCSCATRAGWAQPLPAAHARARAHARPRSRRDPGTRRASTLDDVEEHAEGLVCLSGCARQGVRDEPTMRRLLRAFGRDALPRRAAAPVRTATTARSTAAWPRSPRGSACPAWRRATSTRTRPRARGCRTPSSPSASTRRSTPPSRCAAATTRTCSPRRRRWPRASPTTPRRSPRPRAWPTRCASTSRSDLGYRYPGAEDDEADATLARGLPRALRATATRPATGCAAEAAARLEEELRAHRRARAVGLLPAAPRPARARARGRRRGARRRHRRARCCRPGRGRGLVGVLDRLLPHRPLARRPDRQRAAASGASSTRRSPRCPTSTSTSRATCARS